MVSEHLTAAETERLQIHRITRHHSACAQCGLPTLTCICAQLEPITTSCRFLILTSPKERVRASNTGRLLKLLNPGSTEIRLWERGTQPPELTRRSEHCYLVFPALSAEDEARSISRIDGPAPLFVLLDGTWQEARKIARQSPYLANLPLLALPEMPSRYNLRANSAGLCTIEAAIECLKLADEMASTNHLSQSFELFLQHYQAGLSGHAVKDGSGSVETET